MRKPWVYGSVLCDDCARMICVCNKRFRRLDPTSEEDSYDDIVCVLELLSHLVTKDLVDHSDEPAADKARCSTAEQDTVFWWNGRYCRYGNIVYGIASEDMVYE